MASEVNFDLRIELSDLDYICSHIFLVSKCPHGLNATDTVKGSLVPLRAHWEKLAWNGTV